MYRIIALGVLGAPSVGSTHQGHSIVTPLICTLCMETDWLAVNQWFPTADLFEGTWLEAGPESSQRQCCHSHEFFQVLPVENSTATLLLPLTRLSAPLPQRILSLLLFCLGQVSVAPPVLSGW